MLALYATGITFIILLIIAVCYFIHMMKEKKGDGLFYFLMVPMIVFFAVVTAIFGYDIVQHLSGEAQYVVGSCETEYVRGGKSVDTTNVVIGEETYKVKSSEFKELKDGTYSCELTYVPLTKFVIDATIE